MSRASMRTPWTAESWGGSTSVWLTGQRDRVAQLHDGAYVAETLNDNQGMLPAIAAEAMSRYSGPDSVVVDPDCGAGTVLVEALRLGRHAIGLTGSRRWWRVARANVTAAKAAGAWHDAAVVDVGGGLGGAVGRRGLVSRADLILTVVRRRTREGSRCSDPNFDAVARQWIGLLRLGGYVVVVVPSWRADDGTLVDVASAVVDAAAVAGLVQVDCCVALTGRVWGRRVVPWSSAGEREEVDRARSMGMSRGLVAHQTVLVLQSSSVAGRSLSRSTAELGAGL